MIHHDSWWCFTMFYHLRTIHGISISHKWMIWMPYFSIHFPYFSPGIPFQAVSFDLPKLANEPCWEPSWVIRVELPPFSNATRGWKRLTRSKKPGLQLGSRAVWPRQLGSWMNLTISDLGWEFEFWPTKMGYDLGNQWWSQLMWSNGMFPWALVSRMHFAIGSSTMTEEYIGKMLDFLVAFHRQIQETGWRIVDEPTSWWVMLQPKTPESRNQSGNLAVQESSQCGPK